MTSLHLLGFDVGPIPDDDRDSLAITPTVDGTSLATLIARFETRQGFEPAGGYAGIVPSAFAYGDLAGYYLGANERQWPTEQHLWLLGCDCGEAGCWPLEARVIADDDTVSWTAFTQPHRRERDYRAFEPITFGRAQYAAAVASASERLAG